ncbi:MAG: hypothetical protein BWY84_00764 [Candidatus Aerophobetes bacterium ADurb.Bin490]|nr:MAG: hypothetical protein BWY84_00764 [Candidatus Aerophobetes bacterium ADurb.Bin490]
MKKLTDSLKPFLEKYEAPPANGIIAVPSEKLHTVKTKKMPARAMARGEAPSANTAVAPSA